MPLPRHIRKPGNKRSTIPRPKQGRPEFPGTVLRAKKNIKEVELYTAYRGPGQAALRTWIRTYLPSLRYYNGGIQWRHRGMQEGDATVKIVTDSGEQSVNVTKEDLSHSQILELVSEDTHVCQPER